MFRLLSKESNIFSIPVYIGFLLLIIISFNIMDFNTLDLTSAIITFAGISLGYFLFNAIALNYQSHLPLFLYTFFVLACYPGDLNIGLAISLLINSILLLILTSKSDKLRKGSYLLVGALLAINYLFLPAFWPTILFVIVHIFVTSGKPISNLIKFIFGAFLVIMSYLGIMYILDYRSLNPYYWPFDLGFGVRYNYGALQILIPIILMVLYAIFDHFKHFNEKSPISKYNYTFLLLFSFAQLITLILYMDSSYDFLLIIALPITIIISRMLKFLPKYWMKETGLWIIILTLLIFKLTSYISI